MVYDVLIHLHRHCLVFSVQLLDFAGEAKLFKRREQIDHATFAFDDHDHDAYVLCYCGSDEGDKWRFGKPWAAKSIKDAM